MSKISHIPHQVAPKPRDVPDGLTTTRKISLLKLIARKERTFSTIDLNIQLLLLKLSVSEKKAKDLRSSIAAAARELRGE